MKELFLVFVLFIVIPGFCHSQELLGTYKRADGGKNFETGGDIITFNKDSSFEIKEFTHTGSTIISQGRFHINSDSLFLNYMGPFQENYYEVVESKILKVTEESKDFIYSDIQVLNSEGKPQRGVILALRNKEKDIVMGFESDANGKFPDLNIQDDYIQYLHFSWLGHQEVSIPAMNLKGKSTQIVIPLKSDEIKSGNRSDTEVYLIKNINSGILELLSVKSENTPIVKWQKIQS